MHNLIVSSLAVAYLAANTYAIVKVGVFELARSRKHLLLYGVPFILWGSVILIGCKLMEIMRRFDEWAASWPIESNALIDLGLCFVFRIDPHKRACRK